MSEGLNSHKNAGSMQPWDLTASALASGDRASIVAYKAKGSSLISSGSLHSYHNHGFIGAVKRKNVSVIAWLGMEPTDGEPYDGKLSRTVRGAVLLTLLMYYLRSI